MPPRISPLSDNARGALWVVISVAGATLMTFGVRQMAGDLHPAMIAFLRSAFAGVLVLPLLVPRQRRARLRFSAGWRHPVRGLLIATALVTGFYAIWKIPLATATVLFFMAPVFATALAVPMAGEKVGPRRWAAIGAGVAGAIIILRPGVVAFEPAMLVALVSSLAFAGALILGKQAAQADGSEAVFISSSLTVAVATLPPALFVWQLPDQAWQWGILAMVVAGSSLRTYADIRAYAIGDAGFLAPFAYLRLITIGGLGILVFGERLDAATVAGGSVIIAATLYIALREARLKPGKGSPKLP